MERTIRAATQMAITDAKRTSHLTRHAAISPAVTIVQKPSVDFFSISASTAFSQDFRDRISINSVSARLPNLVRQGRFAPNLSLVRIGGSVLGVNSHSFSPIDFSPGVVHAVCKSPIRADGQHPQNR